MVNAAAERLFCRPNTVRHRLRRIEKRTGRSLSRPRDVAEPCLAIEVHRRLMWPKLIETVDERKAATITITRHSWVVAEAPPRITCTP